MPTSTSGITATHMKRRLSDKDREIEALKRQLCEMEVAKPVLVSETGLTLTERQRRERVTRGAGHYK